MSMMAEEMAPGDVTSPGEGEKLSQADANYRRGLPTKHCGVCDYYEGNDTQSCTRVEGPISGYGISDVFKMQSNPFGSMIGPQEAAVINGMMQSGPDQSPHVQPDAPAPPLTIGNKTYS
jgi:hypothetical protein